jgi:hypothetical protein
MAVMHGVDSNSKVVPLLVDSTGKPIVTGTVTAVLGAGSAVIGHVITDIGSVVNATLQASSAVIGKVDIDTGQNIGVGGYYTGTFKAFQTDVNGVHRVTEDLLDTAFGVNSLRAISTINTRDDGTGHTKRINNLAIESVIQLSYVNNSVGAGTNTLTSSAVPANKVWVIKRLSFSYTGVFAPVLMTGFYVVGGVTLYLDTTKQSGNGYITGSTSECVLSAGSTVNVVFQNCTAGDVIFMGFNAYQMDIS